MSKPMDSEQKARLFGRLCAIEDIATSIQSEVNGSDPDRADHDLWEEMETLKEDIRDRVNSMFLAYEDDDRIANANKSEQTFRELYLALKNLKEAIYGHGYRPYETVDDDDPLYVAYNKAEELLKKFSPHPNPPSSVDPAETQS